MKRFISAVLCILMLFAMLPLSALAEGARCTASDGCTLPDGHEGACALAEPVREETVPEPQSEQEPPAEQTPEPVAPAPEETPTPGEESPAPADTPAPTKAPEETPAPQESPAPDETPAPEETPATEETPAPTDTATPTDTPEPEQTADVPLYGAGDGEYKPADTKYAWLTYTYDDAGNATFTGLGTGGGKELSIPARFDHDADATTPELVTTAIASNAFKGKTTLTGALTIPYTVTTIGQSAFEGCSGLKGSLVFEDDADGGKPSALVTIERYAFKNAGFSGGLKLPNSVTTIGNYAFQSCEFDGVLTISTGMPEINTGVFYDTGFSGTLEIPANIAMVGAYAFMNCENLTTSTMLPTLARIGEKAFMNCTGMRALTLPIGLTRIDKDAFSGCTGFRGNLVIPDTVTTIGESAFQNCGFLGTLTLSSNPAFTEIADSTFSGCGNLLGTLTIPGNVEKIGAHAFDHCVLLQRLVLSDGLTEVGESAFESCSSFVGTLTIPGSVTTLGKNAFAKCGFSGGLALSPGLVTIGEGAFSGSPHLWGVLTIPYTVTTIGNNAFDGCVGFVSSLVFENDPDGGKASQLTAIGDFAFRNCPLRNSLHIPKSVTSIGEEAFSECKGLDGRLTFEDGSALTSIGQYAFENVPFTGDITIPAGVTAIENGTFYNCTKINGKLTLLGTVTSVGDLAFFGCKDMQWKDPNLGSATSIGYSAFRGCAKLSGALDLSSATAIGAYAFSGCEGFTGRLSLNSGLTMLEDYAFCGCIRMFSAVDASESFVLPAGITSIGDAVFSNWYGLRGKLVLPESLTTIGDSAFFRVLNTKDPIVIPAGVTRIGDRAFDDMKVTQFWFLGEPPEIVTRRYDDMRSFPLAATMYCLPDLHWPIDDGKWAGQGYPIKRAEIAITGPDYVLPDQADVAVYAASFGMPDVTYDWELTDNASTGATIVKNDALATLTSGSLGTLELAAIVQLSGAEILRATKTIEVTTPKLSIIGGDAVFAGRTLQLTARLVPPPATGAATPAVVWSIEDGADEVYATIDEKTGRVTASLATEMKEITVTAAMDADPTPLTATKSIKVRPLASEVVIRPEGETENLAGTTVPMDWNTTDELILNAGVLPDGAFGADGAVEWSWATSTSAFATLKTETVDGKPTGKLTISAPKMVDDAGNPVDVPAEARPAGIVTLTAKATDGSKKTATVKVRFARFADTVEIDNAPEYLTGGRSVDLVATLTAGAAPTDTKVLWSLDEADLAYAAISERGRLTTRPVPRQITITVTASVMGNPLMTDTERITLCPNPTKSVIYIDGNAEPCGKGEVIRINVAGRTDANPPPPLVLRGEVLPAGAGDARFMYWQTGDEKRDPLILTITDNYDGTCSVVARWRMVDNTPGACREDYTPGDVKLAYVDSATGAFSGVTIQVGRFVDEIAFNENAVELTSGTSRFLTTNVRSVSPVQARSKSLSWRLADPSDAAYVSLESNGKATAKTVYENHDVEVIATARDGYGATARFTLRIVPKRTDTLLLKDGAENVNGKKLRLQVGDSMTLETIRRDALGVETPVTADKWSVSGAAVSVDAGGQVTALKNGTSVVTAKYGTLTAKVTYQVVTFVTGVTVETKNRGPAEAFTDKYLALNAVVQPKTATDKKMIWSLDPGDELYATINSGNGLLKVKSTVTREQTVMVTATAADGSGVSGSLSVTLRPAATGVGILLDGALYNNRTMTVDIGATTSLPIDAEVYPTAEGARQQVKWSPTSSRGAIYVDAASGEIKFNRPGGATVTATATDGSGKKASCKVVVVNRVSGIAFTPPASLLGGRKLALKATATTGNAWKPSNGKLLWRLNPEDAPYAAINASGVLSAKRVTEEHIVHVTVTSADSLIGPLVTAEADILIRPAVSSIALFLAGERVDRRIWPWQPKVEVAVGGSATLTAECYPLMGTLQGVRLSRMSKSGVVRAAVDAATGEITLTGVKAGTVTLTFAATDGSGKSTWVRVRVP